MVVVVGLVDLAPLTLAIVGRSTRAGPAVPWHCYYLAPWATRGPVDVGVARNAHY